MPVPVCCSVGLSLLFILTFRLQHTATHCNTLQHTATIVITSLVSGIWYSFQVAIREHYYYIFFAHSEQQADVGEIHEIKY